MVFAGFRIFSFLADQPQQRKPVKPASTLPSRHPGKCCLCSVFPRVLPSAAFCPHPPMLAFLPSINLSKSNRSTHRFRRSRPPFPGSAPKRTTGNAPSAISSSRRSPLQERYLQAPSRDRRRTGYAIRSSLLKLSVSCLILNGVTRFPVTLSAFNSALSHQTSSTLHGSTTELLPRDCTCWPRPSRVSEVQTPGPAKARLLQLHGSCWPSSVDGE